MTRKCKYCGCLTTPQIAPDPYTTDGTVEVCPNCNNAESYYVEMNITAADLNDENPGVILANELGVDMDSLHRRLSECVIVEQISSREAQFLKACMEVACEY